MRIAINGLAAKSEGSLSYLVNLIPQLSLQDPRSTFIVYSSRKTANRIRGEVSALNSLVEYHSISGLNSPYKRILWENIWLDRQMKSDHIDVLFCPIPPVPLLCSISTVVALRNMAPYCPKFSLPPTISERLRYEYLRALVTWSLHKAKGIILVSASSRDLLSKKHKLGSRVFPVIYHGRNPAFTPLPKEVAKRTVQSTLNIHSPYFLYTSPTYHYKNHAELIDAYSILRHRFNRSELLVIAGRKLEPSYSVAWEHAKKSGVSDSVMFLGDVDYRLLPSLYNASEMILYSSVIEACPNIIIESLACGKPMAVSNIPVVQEICSDTVAYFDPFNPESMAQTIFQLAMDGDRKQDLASRALQRAQDFSWEKTARQTLTVFEQAAS